MNQRLSQMVLVFPVELLAKFGRFQGYTLDTQRYLPLLLDPTNNLFMDRDHAEKDVRYKQIIPYVVLRCGDSVFSYVRGKKSTESRLVSSRSIGVGGHIEPDDRSLFHSDHDLYLEAARREVNEEVELESPYVEFIVALINDDSNDVGKVHLGIVHIWDVAEPKVKKREGLITQAGFSPLENLQARIGELETWSQIALKVLAEPRVPHWKSPIFQKVSVAEDL